MFKLHPLIVIASLAAILPTAVPAFADLTAAITADTWIEAHRPGRNFNGGTQGSALIDGNDPSGQIRWVVEDSNFHARATIFEFELPLLPAGETVTGIRLSLWDGEGDFDPNIDTQIGWLTGNVPLMRKITYLDIAPAGFSGNENDFDAIDQSTQRINYDPAKVQFASNANSTEDLMALTLPGKKSNRANPHPPYEDLTAADGLAQYIASRIDAAQTQKIHVILSPTDNTNAITLIHGIDASTPTSDLWRDVLGKPGNSDFYPKLEILTDHAAAPVPEPAAMILLAAGLVMVLGRSHARRLIRHTAGMPMMVLATSVLILGLATQQQAHADLDALLIGETYVDTTFSGNNFANGVQGAGRIPGLPKFDNYLFTKGPGPGDGSTIAGNEVGGLLHWEIVTDVENTESRCRETAILISPCGYARATVLQFELPALPAGQTVSGVRLTLYDTEEISDRNLSADVGWITAEVPILPFLTFEDLSNGFSSNFHGGINAMNQDDQTIEYDPAKVQFAGDLERMSLQISGSMLNGDANNDGQVTGADLISVQQNFGNVGNTPLTGDANKDGLVTGADLISVQQNFGDIASGGTELPDRYPVYEDNTVTDGLAQFIAAQIDSDRTTIVNIILSPQGDEQFMALIHGSNSATWNAPPDELGILPNPQFEPAMQVLTQQTNSAPIPEPATAILTVAGILVLSGSRQRKGYGL